MGGIGGRHDLVDRGLVVVAEPGRMLAGFAIGRLLLVLGAIVFIAAFTTHWWWSTAGIVLMAAGFGFIRLGLRAQATRGERGSA